MQGSMCAVITDKVEGRRRGLVVRKHVKGRRLHNHLWRAMQVGTKKASLYCAITHLLNLLQLILRGVSADRINRDIRPVRCARKLRSHRGPGRYEQEERSRADEHDHGEHAQPGDQQKTPHALET